MSQEKLILTIGGHNRMRSDLVSAITRLTLQIKAIGRRIDRQVKASGHGRDDTRMSTAGSSDEQVGHQTPDTPSLIAPAHQAHGEAGDMPGLVTVPEIDETSSDEANGHNSTDALITTAPSRQEGDEVALYTDLVTTHLNEARKGLIVHRAALDRKLIKLVTQLDIWPWADAIKGVGALSIAQIVGEAGDLSNYGNPAKVWKMFGMHVVDGEAARPKAGVQLNYSPRRRAVMHVVGECLIKQNDTPYKTLYSERKQFEILKAPELKPFMHHKRAMRYMEKRFLRDLWRQWNGRGMNTADQ